MAKSAILGLTGAFALVSMAAGNNNQPNGKAVETQVTLSDDSLQDAPFAVPIQRQRIVNFPPAPRNLGDYDRTLPLQQCEDLLGDQFANMTDVVRYLINPHLTPVVTSPGMSEAQIRRAQSRLAILGFDTEPDGMQGRATTRALMEFQMFWGPIADSMSINGRLDSNVLAHLEYYADLALRDSAQYNVSTEVMASIRLAQLRTGEDFEFLTELIRQESTFRVGVGATTSSAVGLTQFIKNTWWNVLYTSGCNYGLKNYAENIGFEFNERREVTEPVYRGTRRDEDQLLRLRANPRFAAVLGAENGQYERQLIEHWLGESLTERTMKYIVHFKGVDAGYFFFRGYYRTPNNVAANVFPRQARANRNIYYERGNRRHPRSFRQIYSFLDTKFNTGLYHENQPVLAYSPNESQAQDTNRSVSVNIRYNRPIS